MPFVPPWIGAMALAARPNSAPIVVTTDHLLQENGFDLLQENGDLILL